MMLDITAIFQVQNFKPDLVLKGWHGAALVLAVGIWAVVKQLTIPKELAHLPSVPILPLLWSYAKAEAENERIERLILPFANEKGEGVVVVYALGRWIIHVLDCKMVKEVLDNPEEYSKEVPPDGLLLWRLVGYSNVILANGEQWKRHSQIVKSALSGRVPIEEFASLSVKLFKRMAEGGRFSIDKLLMRFTLDAVGTTALGHDFNAIEDEDSPFVREYGDVMEAISNPLYLIFPRLEKWAPRVRLVKQIDSLRVKFDVLMEEKREKPGKDMFTFMLEHPEMTNDECRDNMVVFFIAGHDTAAGALASMVYYLAKNTQIQEKARKEVMSIMGGKEPTQEILRNMPYLSACIREALRLNTPITYIVPRSAKNALELHGLTKSYAIPKGASLIMNLTAVHHNSTYYAEPEDFNPDRWLEVLNIDTSQLTWLPFASGPRQCPARNFAMYEIRTLAAMLLRDWEWTLPVSSAHQERIRNGPSPFALSIPKDLDVDFVRRR